MKTQILNVPRHVPKHWSGMPPITQQIAEAMSGETLTQRYLMRAELEIREPFPAAKIAGIMANNDEQRRIADQKVLDALREHGPMTRSALQMAVGLSSSNICSRVKRLIVSGKVAEGEGYPSLVWVAEDQRG